MNVVFNEFKFPFSQTFVLSFPKTGSKYVNTILHVLVKSSSPSMPTNVSFPSYSQSPIVSLSSKGNIVHESKLAHFVSFLQSDSMSSTQMAPFVLNSTCIIQSLCW